jgi:hypothetical protein
LFFIFFTVIRTNKRKNMISEGTALSSLPTTFYLIIYDSLIKKDMSFTSRKCMFFILLDALTSCFNCLMTFLTCVHTFPLYPIRISGKNTFMLKLFPVFRSLKFFYYSMSMKLFLVWLKLLFGIRILKRPSLNVALMSFSSTRPGNGTICSMRLENWEY